MNMLRSLFFLIFCYSSLAFATATNCPSCNLAGTNFSGQTLSDTNLSFANLRGASFQGATLEGVVFDGADLTGADFRNAKLVTSARGRVSFAASQLADTRWEGASVVGASFMHSNLACQALQAAATQGALTDPPSKACPGLRLPATASARSDSTAWVCPNVGASIGTKQIYVAPSGVDNATCGSAAQTACATPAQGLTQCGAGSASNTCAVLLYYGSYSLSATLTPQSGQSLVGGCLAGASSGTSTSMLTAPANGVPAITVNGATGVNLLNLAVMGSTVTTTATGQPSVAVRVDNNSQVNLAYNSINANVGGTGAAGTNAAAGAVGSNANGITGGSSSCGNTTGGNGGLGMQVDVDYNMTKVTSCNSTNCSASSNNACNGYYGASPSGGGTATLPGKNTGPSCQLACISNCPSSLNASGGGAGNPGSCGSGGAASSLQGGSYVNGVWTASLGTNGGAASSGAGGSGGGGGGGCGYVCFWVSDNKTGGNGGGGGAGGCAPGVATGGQQGGASIALEVVNATVSLNANKFVGNTGGAGGVGGNNGAAASGGQAANGVKPSGASPVAGTGGNGGAGGWSGSSGAGAGGNGGPALTVTFAQGSPQPANILSNVFYDGGGGSQGSAGSTATNGSGAPCSSTAGATGLPGQVTQYVSMQ